MMLKFNATRLMARLLSKGNSELISSEPCYIRDNITLVKSADSLLSETIVSYSSGTGTSFTVSHTVQEGECWEVLAFSAQADQDLTAITHTLRVFRDSTMAGIDFKLIYTATLAANIPLSSDSPGKIRIVLRPGDIIKVTASSISSTTLNSYVLYKRHPEGFSI